MTDNTHANAHNTGAEGVPEHPHITVTPGFLHQLLSLVVGAKPADDVAHMRHVYEQTLQRLSSDIAAKDAALARRREQAKEMHAKIAEAGKETAALRARAEAAEKRAETEIRCGIGMMKERDEARASAEATLAELRVMQADMANGAEMATNISACRAESERDQWRTRAEAAEAKLAEAEPELARWRHSFDGLVFVENEKYAELVADRDRLAAEVTTLHARIAELESRECAHAAYAAQEAQMKQDDDRDRLAAEVVDLQRQQKASDDEIARVNGERDKLLANISALKAALKRYDDASAEVERLKADRAVIDAWNDGSAVECRLKGTDRWHLVDDPAWRYATHDYRVRAAGVEVEP